MATTIKQEEAVPASYPAAPSGLSTEAAALDPAMIWQRIEAYIALRHTARAVTWIAEGPGAWTPTLSPATVSTVHIWRADAWELLPSPDPSPLGGYMLGCGTYKITASVGGGSVPASVDEAYRRLAEYLAGVAQSFGVRQETVDGIGSREIDANAVAKAMIASGAADLLRTYRRAA